MTVGITTVVITFYCYAMPMLWMGNNVVFVLYMIYGHYLLVNIIFHYYMGVFTNPGTPPKVSHSVCVSPIISHSLKQPVAYIFKWDKN